MDQKTEHVAIDVGYGFVKGISSSNKRILIPTLIGLGFEQHLGSIFSKDKKENDRNIHIVYNGENYFVGELAKESNVLSRIFEQKRYNHEYFKIILNVAIQLLTGGKTSQVKLSTGLPLSFYQSQAKEARESMLGIQPAIEWKTGTLAGNVLKNNIVDAVLFPQGASAIYSALMNKEGKYIYPELMSEGTMIGLIDIGFRTTDFIVVEIQNDGSFVPRLGLSSTLDNIGVHQLHHEIKMYYKMKTDGADLSEYHLSRVLKNGFLTYKGEKINFSELIEEKKREISTNIADRLKSFWSEESNLFDEIFLAGGGGLLFADTLQSHFNNRLTLIKESQFANAIGYYRYGNSFFNGKKV